MGKTAIQKHMAYVRSFKRRHRKSSKLAIVKCRRKTRPHRGFKRVGFKRCYKRRTGRPHKRRK